MSSGWSGAGALLLVASCSYDFDARFAGADAAPGDGKAASAEGGACPGGVGGGLPRRLAASSGPARHVAPGGSDAAAGTESAPWQTVQRAFDAAAPGERVVIHAGTYSAPSTFARSGTEAAPITASAAAGDVVTIRGAVTVTGSYLRLAGLVFDGASTALAIEGHDVEVFSCEVRNAAVTGIRIAADRVAVVASFLHDGGGRGIAVASGNDALIASNVVVDHAAVGILLAPSPRRTIVTQNTASRNENGVLLGGDGVGATDGAVLVNNILAFNRGFGSGASFSGTEGTGNSARSNLVFGNPSGTIRTIPSNDTIELDPAFVDAASDLHLRADSPALDRARGEHSVAFDRDGACRPRGGAADLGAYER